LRGLLPTCELTKAKAVVGPLTAAYRRGPQRGKPTAPARPAPLLLLLLLLLLLPCCYLCGRCCPIATQCDMKSIGTGYGMARLRSLDLLPSWPSCEPLSDSQPARRCSAQPAKADMPRGDGHKRKSRAQVRQDSHGAPKFCA
jgi:hypothetical protein